MGEEVMLGSSAGNGAAGAPPDGPDIARSAAPVPEPRLLFREPVGDIDSVLADGIEESLTLFEHQHLCAMRC